MAQNMAKKLSSASKSLSKQLVKTAAKVAAKVAPKMAAKASGTTTNKETSKKVSAKAVPKADLRPIKKSEPKSLSKTQKAVVLKVDKKSDIKNAQKNKVEKAKATADKTAGKLASESSQKLVEKRDLKTAQKAQTELNSSKKVSKYPVEVEGHSAKSEPKILTAEAGTKKPAKSAKAKVDKGLLNLSDKSPVEIQKKWNEYHDKFGREKAPLYNMANSYEAAAPLQHKVLGWGFVVSVQNDRLEVLFESGSKTLISNYRPR